MSDFEGGKNKGKVCGRDKIRERGELRLDALKVKKTKTKIQRKGVDGIDLISTYPNQRSILQN